MSPPQPLAVGRLPLESSPVVLLALPWLLDSVPQPLVSLSHGVLSASLSVSRFPFYKEPILGFGVQPMPV